MRSSRSRPGRAALLLSGVLLSGALLSGALGAGCARPKSYVVLKLESGTPIVDVETVVVDVTQSGMSVTTLRYPSPAITIDETNPSDLSVSFSGGQSGTVTFHVTVLDKYNCKVGESADTTGIIKGGNVGEVIIVLAVFGGCSTRDGGSPDGDGGPGMTFPGCDPVSPGCGMGKTCQVNCTKRVGECTAGGLGAHGATCATNADCAPGSQCFDYAGTGCAVKVCLQFCNHDDGCGTGDAGVAAGTRGICAGPVQCGGVETGYHTCTFGCDPREPAATASTTGCPSGLGCFVVADMDQVGCGCAEKTRVGKDNVPCTSASQCAPGYICMVRDNVCRAICRCNANGMTCTAPNDCSASGKTCTALTNNTVFGACL
jgi:hypothetical protein